MLALSWKQPFASAMLYGKIETRTWETSYRGLVLICSSKVAYDQATVQRICGPDLFYKMCVAMNLTPNFHTIDFHGYAIALGTLIDCRQMVKEDEEKTFVRYRPDLYCHVYEDVKAIHPFPWRGTQGWKEVDAETKNKIILK